VNPRKTSGKVITGRLQISTTTAWKITKRMNSSTGISRARGPQHRTDDQVHQLHRTASQSTIVPKTTKATNDKTYGRRRASRHRRGEMIDAPTSEKISKRNRYSYRAAITDE